MKKAIVVTIILLGLLGGAAMAVSPLLFRIPVIGENVLMQVVALPTGEESPLDWSLTTNPSFTVPQEGNIAKLSPSQVIIEGELRAKNTSSTREISYLLERSHRHIRRCPRRSPHLSNDTLW